MLEPFEGFFDAPALVIKVSKLTGWKTPRVKQVCHQDTDLRVWRDVADQTRLMRYAGALEVQDVLAISCPTRDDLLAKSAALGACRTWGVESENRPQRGQFLPDLQAHSSAMGQKDGKKWTAAVDLQPTIPKSDRLLGKSRTQVKPALPDFSTRMQNGISR